MAEYRMLRDDEVVQEGDEFSMKIEDDWKEVTYRSIGGKPDAWFYLHFRRPLPERGEEFEEWHRRECPTVVFARNAGEEPETCLDLEAREGPSWLSATPWCDGDIGDGCPAKFYGRTCREVWESERGAAPKPSGVKVAPVPQSVLMEQGQVNATASLRVCPGCGHGVPRHLQRCHTPGCSWWRFIP